jgi:hypothetical protein
VPVETEEPSRKSDTKQEEEAERPQDLEMKDEEVE